MPALAAGLIPILFIPISVDAYVLPRAALVLAFGTAAAAIRIGSSRSVVGRLGELRLPALAVAAAILIALLASVNPALSLVGAYARYESAPVRLGYLLLFCLPVWTLRTPAGRRLVITAFLAGCIVASIEALYEAWTGFPARPDGNLGHANLLAALLAMAIPLGLQRTLQAPAWALALVPLTGGLLVTSSRSGWIGAAAGAVILVPLLARTRRGRQLSTAAAAAVVLVAAGVLLLSPLGALHGDTGAARLHVWRDSVGLILERPLVGFGPDTQGLNLGRRLTGDWEPGSSFDRVHELALDLLVTQGALGLAGLGWFWFGWLRRCLRHCQSDGSGAEELPGLLAAWAGYVAITSLNFDWAPATGPLWLLAGVAWSAVAPAPAPGPGRRRAGSVVVAVAVIIAGGLAAMLPVAADLAHARGDDDVALALDPLQAEYHRDLGAALISRGRLAAGADQLALAGQLGESSVTTFIELGDAQAALGHRDLAAAAYRRGAELDRFDPRPRQRLAALGGG